MAVTAALLVLEHVVAGVRVSQKWIPAERDFVDAARVPRLHFMAFACICVAMAAQGYFGQGHWPATPGLVAVMISSLVAVGALMRSNRSSATRVAAAVTSSATRTRRGR